jgi:hypothetical protein
MDPARRPGRKMKKTWRAMTLGNSCVTGSLENFGELRRDVPSIDRPHE